MPNWKRGLVRFVANRRDRLVFRKAANAARFYLVLYANVNYDQATNGERRVLEKLAIGDMRCVFDVGANLGDWTHEARSLMPRAAVHCFELVPGIAERLETRFADDPAVTVNPVGLSDEVTEVTVGYAPAAPFMSSLHPLPYKVAREAVAGRVTTGDAYCEENGIDQIDLLKVDVEGHEVAVLQGFEGMLSSDAVRAIQFEYGRPSIVTHALLRDLYELLEGHGFTVGKVFPRSVDFRPYDWLVDEDFLGPNYLAVQRSERDLVRRCSS